MILRSSPGHDSRDYNFVTAMIAEATTHTPFSAARPLAEDLTRAEDHLVRALSHGYDVLHNR